MSSPSDAPLPAMDSSLSLGGRGGQAERGSRPRTTHSARAGAGRRGPGENAGSPRVPDPRQRGADASGRRQAGVSPTSVKTRADSPRVLANHGPTGSEGRVKAIVAKARAALSVGS